MILPAEMAHARKLVRHAVVTLLTNATAAGTRVKPTRVDPNKRGGLPAIGVYTLSETSDQEQALTVTPRELHRDLDLKIEGLVADTAAVPFDDAMDDLAEQIEAAMDADPFLGGTAGECVLVATDMGPSREEGADPLIGVVTLTYSVTYRTSPAPLDLDDFLRARTTQQVVTGIPGDTVSVVDEFTVQETPP